MYPECPASVEPSEAPLPFMETDTVIVGKLVCLLPLATPWSIIVVQHHASNLVQD